MVILAGRPYRGVGGEELGDGDLFFFCHSFPSGEVRAVFGVGGNCKYIQFHCCFRVVAAFCHHHYAELGECRSKESMEGRTQAYKVRFGL